MSENNSKRRIKKFENLTKEDYDFLIDQIEELRNNSGGGDFIPLTGTEEGKPVTGDINFNYDEELRGIIGIDTYDSEEIALMSVDKSRKTTICGFHNNAESVTFTDTSSLYGGNDFSEIQPENKLIYAQRSYVDKSNSYSTDEIKTGGTWIDGKPIYRKVIPFIINNDGVFSIDLSTYEIGNYFKSEALLLDDNFELINEFLSITSNQIIQFQSRKAFPNILEILCVATEITSGDSSAFNAGMSGNVILEYTKTTD